MDDLLKEAIADAKAVRETALANAKMALEEAFTPKLKSMLAKKIQHEIEDEGEDVADEPVSEEELEDEDEDAVAESSDDSMAPPAEDADVDVQEQELSDEDEDAVEEQELADEDDVVDPANSEAGGPVSEEEHSDEDEEPVAEEEHSDEDGDELDLEAILKELEEEDDEPVEEEYEDESTEDGHEEVSENDVSSEIGDADNKVNDDANDSSETGAQGPEGEGSDSAAGHENSEDEVVKEEEEPVEEEDDIDLEEVLKALSEEDDAEADDSVEEVNKLQAEIKEHRDVVKYLRGKLNEVNLLNAKLLFSNKLFRAFGLTNEQKMKVVETFDRARNLREIKLVYSTLAESFNGRKAQPIKESKGSSSKAVASTKPQKEVISEGEELKNRFKKLANII